MLRAAFVVSAAVAALLASPHLTRAQEYGAAPWCAVLNLGTGSTYWDCQYASQQQCAPNVLAGNRGFCNPNPYFANGRREDARHCRIVRHHAWRHGHRVTVRERRCW